MLDTMTRVQIIGLHAQLERTLATIGRLGMLHLEDATKGSALKSLALDPQRVRLQEDLSFLAARLDSLIQLLPTIDTTFVPLEHGLPDSAQELAAYIRTALDRIAPPLHTLAQQRDDFHAEALALPRYEAMLHKLLPLAAELRVPPGFDTLALYIDKRYRDALELLRVAVEHVTQAQVVAADVDDRTLAALVVFPHAFSVKVHATLEHENITQVRLPKEIAGRTFHDARRALEERHHAVRSEIAAIN